MGKGFEQIQGKIEQAKNAVVDAVDMNGNGEIDIEDVKLF